MLLIMLDALGDSSKYTILSIELNMNISISYRQIKLIDRVANFGDYGKNYVSIIMPNSIIMSKITNEDDSRVAYLSYNGVNNPKITKLPNHLGVYLVYNHESNLVGNGGFLVFETEQKELTNSKY